MFLESQYGCITVKRIIFLGDELMGRTSGGHGKRHVCSQQDSGTQNMFDTAMRCHSEMLFRAQQFCWQKCPANTILDGVETPRRTLHEP